MQDFQAIPNLPGRIFPLSLPDLTTTRRLLLLRSNYPHHHQHPQPVKCPRCESTNTKFCYYNNYNLSQPRHFCKSCRRYWTKGGVLRNVPVGGGARKNPTSKPKPKPVSASASSNPNPDPLPEPASASPDPGFGFHFPDPGLLPGFRVAEPGRKEEVDVSGSGSLFDITSSADPAVYWNQTNWGDTDPCSLYLHSI